MPNPSSSLLPLDLPFHFAIIYTPRGHTRSSPPCHGIHHIITTEETPLDEKWFVGKRVTHPLCLTLEGVDRIYSRTKITCRWSCTLQLKRADGEAVIAVRWV